MHKLGLAMSGGSTKGAFQAGVLQGLKQSGHLDNVTYSIGTSVGAINSAALTSMSVDDLANIYLNHLSKRSDVFKFSPWGLRGIFSLEPVYKILKDLIKNNNPNKIEAVSCSVDIGYEDAPLIYGSNKLLPFNDWLSSVMGSATIPVLMHWGHHTLRDGGIREYIPISKALDDCEKVIAIATSPVQPKLGQRKQFKPRIINDLWHTVDNGFQQEIKKNDFLHAVKHQDRVTVITPKEYLPVGQFEVSHDKMKMMIQKGYEMGLQAVMSWD